ncbi:MAG TPA: response regulator [Chloroflexi bacterium]|nr:response regulator [Chloroflexota bacterium]
MSVGVRIDTQETSQVLYDELQDLKRSMIKGFAGAGMPVVWIWYIYCLWSSWHFGLSTIATGVWFVLTVLACWLQRRHVVLAGWLLCFSYCVALMALVGTSPSPLSMAGGVTLIVAGGALLGPWGALVMGVIGWWGAILAYQTAMGGTVALSVSSGLAALYFLVWMATAVASRPMTVSVAWALAGWSEARRNLQDTQARRAELYRALRALEESTYRIEQMNRQLVTARHEAEVARAQKAQFAATVSHELRGPLSLILGFSRAMALTPERYGVPLPDPYWADIDAIYRNSQHLSALVDDVLDLAQIDAERLPLVRDQVDLEADVVVKAVDIVHPLAQRRGLSLRTELAGGLPTIIADQVRLRQALLNILMNAVRFTEHGGVTVRTEMDGDAVLVSVSDTGRGIPAAEIPKLFREFAQAHAPSDAPQELKGSGLGLSISKQLVELHGGRIWVESEEGCGTTVRFTVPLPGAQRAGQGLMRVGGQWCDQDVPEVCLLVHDDPSAAHLLARHLEEFRVVAVRQEREALQLLHDLHPRAIITTPEWQPRVEAMLADTTFSVPIVTCRLPRCADGLPEGVLAYMVKPVPPELVDAVMRQVEVEGTTTVLIVDDDPDVVRLMEVMLTALPRPYRILRAYDGQTALRTMTEVVPDVVFLDLLMPGMTGYEVMQHMQASPRLRHVPVAVVSAQDRAEAHMAIHTPIALSYRAGLDVVTAMRCLRELIAVARARYLPTPTPA